MASQVALNLQYDFNYKEFKIQFSTSKQAVDYQQTNHEARILDDEDTVAWIPSPKGLKYITQTDDDNATLNFVGSAEKFHWQKKLPVPNGTEGDSGNQLHIIKGSSFKGNGGNTVEGGPAGE